MASANVVEITDSNFEAEVIKSGTPVLVDFWAEWCGPCRMLGPTIEQLASEYKGKVKVGKLDIDNNRETALKYGIMAIPTVLVFQGGEVRAQMTGLQPKNKLSTALDQLVAARA